MALGSSPKRHRRNKRSFVASMTRDMKVFRKVLKKARKNKKFCRAAARSLLNVGFAAGGAYAETRGASRKGVVEKKVHGVQVERARSALRMFDKVCGLPAAKRS